MDFVGFTKRKLFQFLNLRKNVACFHCTCGTSGEMTMFSLLCDVRPVLQPLGWRCVECAIHHERDMREEQHQVYVAQTSNNRVIMACDLYCCLLPQYEALRTCRSGFPIVAMVTIVSLQLLSSSTLRCHPNTSIWQYIDWETTSPDVVELLLLMFASRSLLFKVIWAEMHQHSFLSRNAAALIFEQKCSSIRFWAEMHQHSFLSRNASAFIFEQKCVSIHFWAEMHQHSFLSRNASAFIFI